MDTLSLLLQSEDLGFYPKLIEKTGGLCKSNIIIRKMVEGRGIISMSPSSFLFFNQ